MPTVTLHHDFETYSDTNLPDVGGAVYHRHHSTEPLMCAYSICDGPRDDAPIEQWLPVEGQRMPADLRDALRDPKVIKVAWNAPFEMGQWQHCVGEEIRLPEWRDAMVMAMCLSFPGKLEKVGEILGLGDEDKKQAAAGKALMKVFSFPRKPTKTDASLRNHWFNPKLAEKWELYKLYNRRDVLAERTVFRKLLPYNISPDEWRTWVLDQQINELGIPINVDMVNRAVEAVDYLIKVRLDRMNELTGLANSNSGEQLLPWLQDQGYPFEDLKAGHVRRAAEAAAESLKRPGSNVNPVYAEVLSLRAEVSQASIKKYLAFQRATCDDGMLRGAFQFAGAQRTWRWAGRLVQLQNLKRPTKEFSKVPAQLQAARHIQFIEPDALELVYRKPIDLLSSSLRTVIQAPDGYVFLDADLNAIENRVLGYMAEDQKILDVFKNKRDPYVDFATYMFGGEYTDLMVEYQGGNSTKRTTSKPAVLGCGYMLSAGKTFENKQTGEIEATGLLGYAWNMFVPLTLEQAELSVQVWRDTFEDVVTYWKTIENAAKRCIRTGQNAEAGPVEFRMDGPFMRMRLPSGRDLSYFRPRIENKMMPWGKVKAAIVYDGLNDKKIWTRIDTHPGKLTENGDQAIARDLLAHGMKLAWKEGVFTRIHIHDQLLPMVKEDEAEEKLKILIQCMEESPKWAPTLPLGSNGHISKIFVKD